MYPASPGIPSMAVRKLKSYRDGLVDSLDGGFSVYKTEVGD